jgi:hypothetical protein
VRLADAVKLFVGIVEQDVDVFAVNHPDSLRSP